jgi:hypothetical protein
MMKDVKYKVWIVFCLIFFLFFSQEGIKAQQKYLQNSVIYNGIPWFDDRGEIINAHGACILEEEGRYYLFGEYKSDTTNAFNGFSCYSSDDLVNWKFERIVLPVQKDGILGPNRVGERVKVMKCPSTGEYVMYMHADDMEYKDPYIGYATCKTIAGDYTFQGPLLFDGNPINRWDMGTFQDSDGSGYLLIHGGIIYRLNKDYHSAEEKVLAGLSGTHGESPAMFRKNGVYFFLFSNLTSWEKNDNFYYTAPSWVILNSAINNCLKIRVPATKRKTYGIKNMHSLAIMKMFSIYFATVQHLLFHLQVSFHLQDLDPASFLFEYWFHRPSDQNHMLAVSPCIQTKMGKKRQNIP